MDWEDGGGGGGACPEQEHANLMLVPLFWCKDKRKMPSAWTIFGTSPAGLSPRQDLRSGANFSPLTCGDSEHLLRQTIQLTDVLSSTKKIAAIVPFHTSKLDKWHAVSRGHGQSLCLTDNNCKWIIPCFHTEQNTAGTSHNYIRSPVIFPVPNNLVAFSTSP